jgi:PAS domain S-box-containing protein
LWVSLESTAAKDDGGFPIFLVVLSDISKRKQAEIAKLESDSLFQDYIEYAPIGIFIADETGRYLHVNPAASRNTGYAREELLERSIPELVLVDWREKAFEAFQQVIETGYSSVEVGLKRANGSKGFMSVEAVRLSPSRLLGFASDITERKRSEADLKESEFIFRESQRVANIGSYKLNFTSGLWTSSSVLSTIFGIDDDYQRTILGWVDLIHPDDQSTMDRYLREEVVGNRRPFEKEYRIIRRTDGAVRWVRGLGEVAFDPEGCPLSMIGTILDITEQKLAGEALRESQGTLRLVLDTVPHGIFWKDGMGTYLGCNRVFAEFVGFSDPSFVIGKDDSDFGWPIEDTNAYRTDDLDVIRTNCPKLRIVEQARRKDGSFIWVRTSKSPLRDSLDRPIGVLGVCEDITEIKRAGEQKEQLQTQLQQSQRMESLGLLAGGVAHDMNNVLGAILALSSAHLASLSKDNPLYSSLKTIRDAATRGGDMVKRLLAFSRQTPSEKRELNLNALLLEEARLLERTTLAKVHLGMDLAPDLHPILGDGSALTHALMNLCVNAVDAMNDGGTLTFRTRNVGVDQIEVTVEDNGCGMTKEVLGRAMDPFFTTKGVGKGTGLGLSLVFTTVNAHGGHLAIQSEPGRGTQVKMMFPSAVPQNLEPGQEAPVRIVSAGHSLHVLLVDDDELIQKSTRMLIEVLGHSVTTSVTGEDALALLEEGFRPDAVILDMNMPGMGGKGTLPRLRRLCPTVPVLLATGRTDQEALDLVAAHPFVTLLSKPFSFEELRGHLHQVAGGGPSGLGA